MSIILLWMSKLLLQLLDTLNRVNINVSLKALEMPNETDECMLCVRSCLGFFECPHMVRTGSTKQKDEALCERSGVDGDNELCGLRKGLMRFML